VFRDATTDATGCASWMNVLAVAWKEDSGFFSLDAALSSAAGWVFGDSTLKGETVHGDAADLVLGVCSEFSPCVAAHGLTGSTEW
jgi:hypothetical protein